MAGNKKFVMKCIMRMVRFVRIVLIVLLMFAIFLPFYKMFVDTINVNNQELYYFLLPVKVSFNRYRTIYNIFIRDGILLNSFILSFICSLIQVFICSLGGYGLAKLPFKGSKFIMILFLLPLLIPRESLEAAFDNMFKYMPLFNFSFFGNKYSIYFLYLFGSGIKTPIFVYLFYCGFKNFSNELIIQSKIDGCNDWQLFWKIAFPNMKKAIIPCFILTFVWQYNDSYLPNYFGLPLDDFDVISTRLATGRMLGSVEATAFMMLLPLLVIYIFIEKTLLNNDLDLNFKKY